MVKYDDKMLEYNFKKIRIALYLTALCICLLMVAQILTRMGY